MPYSSGFRCVVGCVAGHVVGCVVGCVAECVTRKQLARYRSAAGRVGSSIQARTGSAVRAHGRSSVGTRKPLQTGAACVAGDALAVSGARHLARAAESGARGNGFGGGA